MARVAADSEELVAGQEYYVMMVVLPVGIPGNTKVQEAYGDVTADPGDTVESLKNYVLDRAIELWEAEYPRAKYYSIYSFTYV